MIKNSLNLSTLSEGFVLDHIQAGKSMEIYKHLQLDKLDCVVAIIKNEILSRGKLPFYGTSMSHIASQRVALAAGFVPAWAELYCEAIVNSYDNNRN